MTDLLGIGGPIRKMIFDLALAFDSPLVGTYPTFVVRQAILGN